MKYWTVWVAGLATGLAATTSANADTFFLNYEAPGVESTTATFSVMGVENFDGRSSAFSTDYGTAGAITGTYSGGLQILPADQYGGAGGGGKYIVVFAGGSYQLMLSNDPARILMASTISGTGCRRSTRAIRSSSKRPVSRSAP